MEINYSNTDRDGPKADRNANMASQLWKHSKQQLMLDCISASQRYTEQTAVSLTTMNDSTGGLDATKKS